MKDFNQFKTLTSFVVCQSLLAFMFFSLKFTIHSQEKKKVQKLSLWQYPFKSYCTNLYISGTSMYI